MFYRYEFNKQTQFTTVLESIRVNEGVHAQFQYNGALLPFDQGHRDHSTIKKYTLWGHFDSSSPLITGRNSNPLPPPPVT